MTFDFNFICSKRVVLFTMVSSIFILFSSIHVEADSESASTASSSNVNVSSTTTTTSYSDNSTTESSNSQSSYSTAPSTGSLVVPAPSETQSGTSVQPSVSSSSSTSSSSTDSVKDNKAEAQAEVFVPFSYNAKTQVFIELIVEDAKSVANANDLYVCVMIAQAILESGSGSSGLASPPNYNLFGIKGSHNNQSVKMPTYEDDGSGKLFQIESDFRKYNSYKESLEDYANLISEGPGGSISFYKGAWKSQTLTYQDATKFLTGRYATDTLYNQKLDNLIEIYNLSQYDPVHTEIKRVTHIVQEGETLESISQLYNVTSESIMELNNLPDTTIWVGQELLIKEEVIQIINPETQKLLDNKDKLEKQEKVQRLYRAFRTSVDSIEVANNVRINSILTFSDKLNSDESRISSSTSSSMSSSALKSDNPEEHHSYVVQQGDSMKSISQKTGISVETLKKVNHLTSLKVYEGQILYFSSIRF